MATARHRFRHHGDLSIPSSLHQYWAFLTAQAVPGDIEYEYADLGHPSTPARLAELLARRHRDVFCLNDTDSDPQVVRRAGEDVGRLPAAYLPFPAPFELPDDVVAERRNVGAGELWRRSYRPVLDARRRAPVDAPTMPNNMLNTVTDFKAVMLGRDE